MYGAAEGRTRETAMVFNFTRYGSNAAAILEMTFSGDVLHASICECVSKNPIHATGLTTRQVATWWSAAGFTSTDLFKVTAAVPETRLRYKFGGEAVTNDLGTT
jgi:hypothetical protein